MSTLLASIFALGLFSSTVAMHLACRNHPKLLNILPKIMLVMYSLLLVVLTTFTIDFTNGFNMFLNLKGDWFSKDLLTSLQTTTPDLILNTAMMLPIGYGVSHITKNNSAKKAINSVAISLALSLGIEFLQFMLPISRVPSVLDVILNSASGLIGAGAYLTVNKIINNKAKEQQLENKKELGTEFEKIKENNKQNLLQNSQESVKAKITPKKEIEIISLREELGLRNKTIENKTIERENIEREN